MGSASPNVFVVCLPTTKNCIPVSIFLQNPHQSLIGLTDSWSSRQNFSLEKVKSLGLVLLKTGDPANPPRPVAYQVPEDLLVREFQAQEAVPKEQVSSILKLPSSEASGASQGDEEEEEGSGEAEPEDRESYLDQLAGRLSSGTNTRPLSTTTRPPGRRHRMSSSSSSSSSSSDNRGAGNQQDQCLQTDLACCEYRDYSYQPISKEAREAMDENDKVNLIDDPCTTQDQYCNDWGSFREETLEPFKQSLEAAGGFGKFSSDDIKGNIFSARGWQFYSQALSLLPDMTKMGIYSAFHLLMKVAFMILGEVRLHRLEDDSNAQVDTTVGAITAGVQALFVLLYGYIGKRWISGYMEDTKTKKEKDPECSSLQRSQRHLEEADASKEGKEGETTQDSQNPIDPGRRNDRNVTSKEVIVFIVYCTNSNVL